MSARKKRSKKRSGASSKRPPEPFTLYLDQNLGNQIIAGRLREVGARVEIHVAHLRADAPDDEWIALVGRKRWLALTKDKNLRYREAETQAIIRAKARVVVIRAKNLTGHATADMLIKHLDDIQRFASHHRPPFIVGIDRSGRLTRYQFRRGA